MGKGEEGGVLAMVNMARTCFESLAKIKIKVQGLFLEPTLNHSRVACKQ